MGFLPVLQILNLEGHKEADSTGQDIKDIDLRNNNCAPVVSIRAEISNRRIGIRVIDIRVHAGGQNPGHHYFGHCPCGFLHPHTPPWVRSSLQPHPISRMFSFALSGGVHNPHVYRDLSAHFL